MLPTLPQLNLGTAQSEFEVWRILDFHCVVQNMPNAFTDLAKVMRSHILIVNVLARLDVPNRHQVNVEKGCVAPVGRLATPIGQPSTPAGS